MTEATKHAHKANLQCTLHDLLYHSTLVLRNMYKSNAKLKGLLDSMYYYSFLTFLFLFIFFIELYLMCNISFGGTA